MCDLATIAGIAMTGLSTGMNYAAQQKVQGARNDALGAERIRQRGFDQETAAIGTQSRKNYDGADRKGKMEARKLGDFFGAQHPNEPGAEMAIPDTASNVTVAEESKQRGKATKFTNQSAKTLSDLRSFGELLGNNAVLQARGASQVGQIGGFKQGSSNVLGYELDDANHAGDGLKLFGDIVSGLGGMALNKGLSGAPAAAPFKPTTTLGAYVGAPAAPLGFAPPAVNNFLPGYAR